MPFDDEEDNKKINREGVNATPRRILEKKYLDLATSAIVEIEEQLSSEKEDTRANAAKYILNKVADIYKGKDTKSIERMKAKAKTGVYEKSRGNSGRKVSLEAVPVLDFKSKTKG
jgi:hypothetical protein